MPTIWMAASRQASLRYKGEELCARSPLEPRFLASSPQWTALSESVSTANEALCRMRLESREAGVEAV
jgi:hypothetical protein